MRLEEDDGTHKHVQQDKTGTKNTNDTKKENEKPQNQNTTTPTTTTTTSSSSSSSKNNIKKKEFELEDLLYCIPNKITFDPKKTSPLLHFGVFAGLLSFMFILAFMLDDIGTIPEGSNKKRQSIHGVKNTMESFMKYAQAQDKHKLNMSEVNICDLYIASSSIPDKHIGIFAGKSFKQGDIVLNEGISIMLSSLALQLPHLLLNSHPNITNVSPSTTTLTNECHEKPFEHCIVPSVQASRDIAPGDELFYPYNEDKQRLALAEEMNTKYNLLDDIVKDIVRRHSPRRAGNQINNNFGLNDSILRTIKSIIDKFDSSISKLLPIDSNKLKNYLMSGSAYQTMQNRTLPFLLRNGVCMMQQQQPSSSHSSVASKKIQINENITRIPLFPLKTTMKQNDDKLLSFVKYWNCFLYPSLSFELNNYYLCPTIPTKFSNVKSEINAKYEWKITTRKGKDYILNSLINIDDGKVIDGLELNIIAIRNISKEEEIIIGYEKQKQINACDTDNSENDQCANGDDAAKDDNNDGDYKVFRI